MNRWNVVILAALIIMLSTPLTMAAEKSSGSSLSASIAGTSTYVWRGIPRTSEAAMQGSLNYKTVEGIHADLFTSSVTGGSELDFTVGFAGAARNIQYDFGLTLYNFPQAEANATSGQEFNFNEIWVSASMDIFNARLASSGDAGNYIELNANIEKIVAGWDLGVHIGSYSVDDNFAGLSYTAGKDYNDYSVSLSTRVNDFNVSFKLSDTSLDDDSYRSIVTVSKTFKP